MIFKLTRFTLFTFFYLFFTILLFAQEKKKEVFVIQLGSFKMPDETRFTSLADLGEIYTEYVPSIRFTRIKLGHYETRKKAEEILKIVHLRGYTKAQIVKDFIIEKTNYSTTKVENNPPLVPPTKQDTTPTEGRKLGRPPMARPPAYSIQLEATEKKIGKVNINDLNQIGRVFEVEQDSLKKLLVGIFTNKDSAEINLAKVRQMGYRDAFIVETNLQNVLTTLPSSPMSEGLAQTYRPIRNLETASFYKRMEGKLNNTYDVIVHAYFSNNSITGFYDDPRNKFRKKFVYYGYRAGTNNLPETQFSSENGLIVKASASPKNEGVKLSFAVKDIETGENLSFSLRETYPTGSAQFDVINIYKKKSYNKAGEREVGVDLYIEYPAVIGLGSQLVENRINMVASQLSDQTGETMMSRVDAYLKEGLEKVSKENQQYQWLSQTYETKILENTKNLLSLRMSSELILAEPESKVVHKSFNMSNGSEITLKDVLNVGFEATLNLILKDKISKQYAKLQPKPTEVKAIVEEMMKNYYFTSQSIVFFRDYQKGKTIAEVIEMSVPYSDIKWLINKNGFLNNFVK
jgi:cell division septation protein DedD